MTPSPYHHTKSDPMTPENLLNRNLLNWPYTPKLLPYYGPQRVTNKATATSPYMPVRQSLFLTKTQQGWKGKTSTGWTGKNGKKFILFCSTLSSPPEFFVKIFGSSIFLDWVLYAARILQLYFHQFWLLKSELLRFYGSILTRDRACFQVQLWIAHKMMEQQ